MYGLLILALPRSPYVHMSAMTADRFTELLPQLQKELDADIFPNVCFQGAFNVSNTRTVTQLFIPCSGLVAARELGYEQIRNILANPEKEVQHVTNIGDWLGIPGKVMFDNADGSVDEVVVTDMYKYLVHERRERSVFRFSPIDLSITDTEPLPTHLYPRDHFYDQVYLDKDGERAFLSYGSCGEEGCVIEPREEKPVQVYGVTYSSLDEVARCYNLPEQYVKERVESDSLEWLEWSYL
ncbi:hypothetical protein BOSOLAPHORUS_274 [Erwinia phage vB_EamM_Bosolaphorus]|uniref:Uncharacterized protein n=1 Tax=Erwinia phage vB_EamM_Bosolaphorus TaxID=2060126 RepID=A0A2H5BIA4_9CAUD|nr:hypothetical protein BOSOLAPHORUS_274 [Erwinia phage vB_EamM_Bosolaphorus]